MPLNKFNPSYTGDQTKRQKKEIYKFEQLLQELEKKEITAPALNSINKEIDKVNAAESKSLLNSQLRKSFHKILSILEKEMKLVAQNHYRNTWLAIGMAAFGIPFGVVFSSVLENYGFIGIGLPIGMTIGIAIGTAKDKKALSEGRQLAFQL